MAVHVPLSTAAQEEARTMMLSTANLLSPADGSPVVAPTQDMVLGCYYLTMDAAVAQEGRPRAQLRERGRRDHRVRARRPRPRDDQPHLAEREEGDAVARARTRRASLTLHEPVDVVVHGWDAETQALVDAPVRTTVGRILFNRILPDRSCASPTSR